MNAPSEAFLHDKLHALHAQADEFIAVRRDIHKHPEMGYKEYRTSDLVAEQLTAWGYEVTRGLGGTGVVGQLKKGTGSKSIGIRADMDALPIDEATGLPYASCNVGIMHACGHDGHTAMLLAAAKHIAQKGVFSGTVNLIFQPAEEGLGGAKKMMEDGLFTQFPCDAVFGMHNMPGHPQGQLVRLRHLAQQRQGRLQMRAGAGGTCTADEQRHVQRPRGAQNPLEVAPDHGLRRRHLARTQVIGPRVNGAHVATDDMWPPCKPSLEGLCCNAITELTGGRQDPQALWPRLVAAQQTRHRAHSSTSSKGACCCAPYTSPSPGSPAHSARGIASLMARISGRSKRRTCSACTP